MHRPVALDPIDASALGAHLHRQGLRCTRAVLAVAELFQSAPANWLPTHAELAGRLAEDDAGVNGVTLYRLLERLLASGLLVRHAAPDERSWRFQWLGLPAARAAAPPPSTVPHFECDACHTHIPLTQADAPTQAVAEALRRTLAELGHQAARVDLAVHGTCADCREDRPDGELHRGPATRAGDDRVQRQ